MVHKRGGWSQNGLGSEYLGHSEVPRVVFLVWWSLESLCFQKRVKRKLCKLESGYGEVGVESPSRRNRKLRSMDGNFKC